MAWSQSVELSFQNAIAYTLQGNPELTAAEEKLSMREQQIQALVSLF